MEAKRYWGRVRSNSGHLPKLVILPTQLTPTNQKKWFDSLVVKQGGMRENPELVRQRTRPFCSCLSQGRDLNL